MPRLSIVVLTHNRKDEVLACLDDLVTKTNGIYPLIVVDNGSADGTAAAIRRYYPTVKIVQSRVNRGRRVAILGWVRSGHLWSHSAMTTHGGTPIL